MKGGSLLGAFLLEVERCFQGFLRRKYLVVLARPDCRVLEHPHVLLHQLRVLSRLHHLLQQLRVGHRLLRPAGHCVPDEVLDGLLGQEHHCLEVRQQSLPPHDVQQRLRHN
jgi:hypothetical protein